MVVVNIRFEIQLQGQLFYLHASLDRQEFYTHLLQYQFL